MSENRPIEIFSGTGGVGKTTLSAARALSLSHKNKKVLLITIDPAKRLKQVLALPDDSAGTVSPVNGQLFNSNNKGALFDALLLSPYQTLKRVAQFPEDAENSILKILTRPTGGMNEIMAIVELQYQFNKNQYDVIILDTPPGKHFLDFLMATAKIKNFFNKTYIDIFNYLGKNIANSDQKQSKNKLQLNPLKSLVSSGVKKILGYLEKVTGTSFVHEFIDAIVIIYKNKNAFLEALTFQENFKKENFCHWYLVTSVEQLKIEETTTLQEKTNKLLHSNNYLALNKCLTPHLSEWKPQHRDLQNLKKVLFEREDKLKEFALNFNKVLEFPEIMSASPQEQVTELATSWDKL